MTPHHLAPAPSTATKYHCQHFTCYALRRLQLKENKTANTNYLFSVTKLTQPVETAKRANASAWVTTLSLDSNNNTHNNHNIPYHIHLVQYLPLLQELQHLDTLTHLKATPPQARHRSPIITRLTKLPR